MKVLKTRMALAVAACMLSASALAESASGVPTCKDVVDAKNVAAMEPEIAEFRHVAFDSAAKHQADLLFRGLKDQGVQSPLPAVLDQYETRFVPVRDGSERLWAQLVASNGGTKKAFQKLCSESGSDLITFYGNLYDVALRKFDEMKSTAR
jgi:hypothetical protein